MPAEKSTTVLLLLLATSVLVADAHAQTRPQPMQPTSPVAPEARQPAVAPAKFEPPDSIHVGDETESKVGSGASAVVPAAHRNHPRHSHHPVEAIPEGSVLDEDIRFEPPTMPGELETYTPSYSRAPSRARYRSSALDEPVATADTFWVRADYLLWSLSRPEAPALVSTSDPGTDREDAGILGLDTTRLLLGNDEIGASAHSGMRFEFGGWFDHYSGTGWHASYMLFDDGSEDDRFDSSQFPILARPFFSIEPTDAGPNADLIAFPGQLSGNVSVESSTMLQSGELMMHWVLHESQYRRLQLIGGYQYSGLEDDLTVRDFRQAVGNGTGLALGTTLTTRDRFEAENNFHGAAVGMLASTRHHQWRLDVGMQMALGNVRSRVQISGDTMTRVPLPGGGHNIQMREQGLLALNSNIGSYEEDLFSVIPQLHIAMGYDITSKARIYVGYRFMYWSQLVRSAEQIDTGLNLSQLDPAGINGELRPRFQMEYADLIAQGLTAGLDFRF